MSKTVQQSMICARVLKIWATTCSFQSRLSQHTAQMLWGLGSFHYNSTILKQNFCSEEFHQASDCNEQNATQKKLYSTSDTTAGLRNKAGQAAEFQKAGKDHMQSVSPSVTTLAPYPQLKAK